MSTAITPLLSLALAVLTAASAAFVPAYFGSRKPGYSHVRDTISELGETRSPVGGRVSYVGFIAIGVLLWLFLIVAARVVPSEAAESFWLLSLVGAGYVGGAIFRCDPGAPPFGSWQNSLHNLFGFGEYAGAAAGFAMLKESNYWSPLSSVMEYAGGLVAVCLLGISFPHPFRGLIQRVAETAIFVGIVLIGAWVYRGGA
jgi:hypothetical protein